MSFGFYFETFALGLLRAIKTSHRKYKRGASLRPEQSSILGNSPSTSFIAGAKYHTAVPPCKSSCNLVRTLHCVSSVEVQESEHDKVGSRCAQQTDGRKAKKHFVLDRFFLTRLAHEKRKEYVGLRIAV